MKFKQSVYARLILAFLTASIALGLLVVGVRPSNGLQSSQEREVENKVPRQVPIRVKLKAAKEAKFKDLSNSEWLRDFELEVTNTSDKPIYFLEFWLMLPDTKTENDSPLAFSLRYGRGDFVRYETRAIATDVPIQPGETHTFAIPEGKQRGWREFKLRRNASDPGKVRIKLVQVSFGDGTGFNSSGEAYPFKRDNLSTAA